MSEAMNERELGRKGLSNKQEVSEVMNKREGGRSKRGRK